MFVLVGGLCSGSVRRVRIRAYPEFGVVAGMVRYGLPSRGWQTKCQKQEGTTMSALRSPNQRQIARRTVFIKALLLREGKPNLPCTLVDISDVGARLMVENPSEVPERFAMVMTEQGVPRRECRLVWRGGNDIGVSFEIDKSRRSRGCELAPGSTLDDALDVFALRS
jgi:hypothetical protein